jgi:hypothetical protein
VQILQEKRKLNINDCWRKLWRTLVTELTVVPSIFDDPKDIDRLVSEWGHVTLCSFLHAVTQIEILFLFIILFIMVCYRKTESYNSQ